MPHSMWGELRETQTERWSHGTNVGVYSAQFMCFPGDNAQSSGTGSPQRVSSFGLASCLSKH